MSLDVGIFNYIIAYKSTLEISGKEEKKLNLKCFVLNWKQINNQYEQGIMVIKLFRASVILSWCDMSIEIMWLETSAK